MTTQAEKDIRSALRQLRGCRNRLAMARTGRMSKADRIRMAYARADCQDAEQRLRALLGAGGTRR